MQQSIPNHCHPFRLGSHQYPFFAGLQSSSESRTIWRPFKHAGNLHATSADYCASHSCPHCMQSACSSLIPQDPYLLSRGLLHVLVQSCSHRHVSHQQSLPPQCYHNRRQIHHLLHHHEVRTSSVHRLLLRRRQKLCPHCRCRRRGWPTVNHCHCSIEVDGSWPY